MVKVLNQTNSHGVYVKQKWREEKICRKILSNKLEIKSLDGELKLYTDNSNLGCSVRNRFKKSKADSNNIVK